MSPELDAAFRRLHSALGRLEAGLTEKTEAERDSALELELQIMQDDRARLATELESAAARLARVEAAATHVGERVGSAIATVRAVLANQDGPGLGRH